MRTLKSTTSTTTTSSTSTAMVVDSASAPPVAAATMQRSPWHSPVPYLFGGLAAMLGLIAFALLILACSYWRLSGQLNGENNGDDLESGDDDEKKKGKDGKGKGSVDYEEQFVVIMAGDHKPTCMAMPVVCSNRSSAKFFEVKNESDGNKNGCDDDEKAAPEAALGESVKEEMRLEEVDVHHRLQSDHEESHQLHSHHHHHQEQHHTQVEPAESSSS